MRQVIFNHYVNKFRTYLSFSLKVLHGELLSREEECSNIIPQCTKETCISRENKGHVKEKKLPAGKKIALELIYQKLGHRSTRSLLVGDTANIWGDVEIRIDPDPFFTSCQISPMNKKARSKIPLNPKAPFK